MPEDHRHCRVCGKVVGPGKEFCSTACQDKREAQNRSRKNLTYLIYAFIAFFVLLLLVSYVH